MNFVYALINLMQINGIEISEEKAIEILNLPVMIPDCYTPKHEINDAKMENLWREIEAVTNETLLKYNQAKSQEEEVTRPLTLVNVISSRRRGRHGRSMVDSAPLATIYEVSDKESDQESVDDRDGIDLHGILAYYADEFRDMDINMREKILSMIPQYFPTAETQKLKFLDFFIANWHFALYIYSLCEENEDCTDGTDGTCYDYECYYSTEPVGGEGGGNKKSRKMKSNKSNKSRRTRKNKTRRKGKSKKSRKMRKKKELKRTNRYK